MDSNRFSVKLGEYKGIVVEKANIEPSEEEIAAFLAGEQKRHTALAAVERPAALGDTVVIDFAGYVGETQFEGGTAENYSLVLGSNSFIPGFEDQLVGSNAGDKVDVEVTFPETYHSSELAGKPAVFKCTVHQVQEQKVPEINDAFAMQYGLDSVETLKNAARDAIRQQKAQQSMQELENKLVAAVVENSEVTVSDEFVDDCVTQFVHMFEQQIAGQGVTLDAYLQYVGMDLDGMRAQFRPQAEASAKSTAVLLAVADAEGITVSEVELEDELRRMAETYDLDVAEMKKGMTEENFEAIRAGMKTQRALQVVVDASVAG